MNLAIQRAQLLNHAWLPGLRQAAATGKSEAHLRRLSIISPVDIDREMPMPR